MKLLRRFDWTDRLLTEAEKYAFGKILVEYHDIFARHRMDIGLNMEFKVRLTPKDDRAVYHQSLPMPIHLKELLIIELALMHKGGIITVLPFSKYETYSYNSRESVEIESCTGDNQLLTRWSFRKWLYQFRMGKKMVEDLNVWMSCVHNWTEFYCIKYWKPSIKFLSNFFQPFLWIFEE